MNLHFKQEDKEIIVTAENNRGYNYYEFTPEKIKAVAAKFTTEGPVDIALVLPESLKADLEPFATKELAKILGAGVEASFSKKVSGGFKIGPKEGGYFVSFTEETFNQLIAEYLRPTTKKLLFG